MGNSYNLKGTYAATATALFIGMPYVVGSYDYSKLPRIADQKYESFAEAGKIISEALSVPTGSLHSPGSMLVLMTEAATRLVTESQPLNRDFARVIQKEFWNLVQ